MTATLTVHTATRGVRCVDLYSVFPNAWSDKYHDAGTFLACVACGRKVSSKGESNGITIGGGGVEIIHPQDVTLDEYDPGFLGWFPIGSECIKALPAEWISPNPYGDKVRGF